MEHQRRTRQVASIEEELERMISRGELPETGILPSEQMLARQYGVARGTIREALMRLATRGLLVRQQGRQARAVPLAHVVTLENLGVVLHDLRGESAGRRRFLEGYFELKREVTVELLARGGELPSEQERQRLVQTCFALWDETRWDDGARRWVELEFKLLEQAASAADRPGHFLLVKSLERAFQGMAGVVRPLLPTEAVHRWSQQAMYWLDERDTAALRHELPPLLLACDEHVLERLGTATPGSRTRPAVTHTP